MIAVHNMSKLLSSLILCIKVLFLRVIDKILRPQICQRNINTRKQLVTLNVSVGVNMGAMLRYTSHGSSKKYVDIFYTCISECRKCCWRRNISYSGRCKSTNSVIIPSMLTRINRTLSNEIHVHLKYIRFVI